jgi:hypothetical protein
LLQTAAADHISIDRIQERDPANALESVSRDFVLRDLKDGVAGTMRSADVELRVGPTGSPEALTLRIGEVRSQAVDLGEASRYLTGGGSGEAKRLLVRFVANDLELKTADAAVNIERVELAGLHGRAPAAAPPTEVSEPAHAAQLANYLHDVVGHLRISRYSVEGVAVKGPGQEVFSADAFTLNGLSGRELDVLEIRGLAFRNPDASVRLGRIEIERVTYGKLIDFALTAVADGREPDPTANEIIDVLPRLGGILARRVEVSTRDGTGSLRRFRFEMGGQGFIPEWLSAALVDLKLDLSRMTADDARDKLAALGYRDLQATARLQLRWQPEAKALVLDDTRLRIEQAGQIDLVVRLGNVDPMAAIAKPDAAESVLQSARFESAEIRLDDLGLADRFFEDIARTTGIPKEAIRAKIAAEMRAQAVEMFGPALSAASADAVEAFLRSPGRLIARAVPSDGGTAVTLSDFERLGPEVLKRITITIEAERK